MVSVAAGPQNSGNVNYFFHIIVFLCITFLFGKLDPIAPLTPFGMNTIGVFLGVIYAWVFIDIIWPSMVGLLALMLLDVLPATALLNKGFGDPTVIMMMFIFVFSATLDRYGLAKYISLWFVSRKCVMGKPWRLTFALLLAIAILGGLTKRHARGRHRLEPSVRRIRHLWLQKRRRLPHHDDHRHRVRRAARHVARPFQIPAARGHQRL